IPFEIPDPKLWWCHTLGEQNIYELEITLIKKNEIIDKIILKLGLTEIKLINSKDETGSSFYFENNGIPVFAKGANWVPLNSFPSKLKYEDYKKILTEAKAMHINMLRVWGGGIYESEYFYDICDSLGIMVWQDFMYACAIYPFDDFNKENLLSEILEISNTVGNHPSIAIWCGNNENQEGWINWGWQKQFNYSFYDSIAAGNMNHELFNIYIPQLLNATSKKLFYLPSSPANGYGHPESLTEGDCHYWGVWWGKEPFEVFNEKIPRFMSEYGFQGMPCYNSFQEFIPLNQIYFGSSAVNTHQKHPIGYETIEEYMQRDYKIPDSFEDYAYVSQLLQAKGMKTAIEAHRRNKPYCMGTLFWQLNDCWPVTSWSVIDYFGNRKAAYYTVKEKYDDVIISSIIENDSLNIYVISDLNKQLNKKLSVHFSTVDGKFISVTRSDISIPPNSSALYFSIPLDTIDQNRDSVVVYSFFGEFITPEVQDIFTFAKPVDLPLSKPKYYLEIDTAYHSLTVSSDVFIKGMYFYSEEQELKLSDNFFDLIPGTRKTVYYEEPLTEFILSRIQIKCLNTVYAN
ncbi:MAG: glycoside hydrolase family 2 protein, partial [Chitinophagales bacterium]